jgi:N-acetylglucosamine-6-phosphate deacetylase
VFKAFYDGCGGIIRLVDIAPECDVRGDFIEKASKLCTVSVAHTATDYDGAKAAFRRGATHATHLFNAMSGMTHRAPGVVGAVFDTDTVCGELICDGIHIHPAVVRTAFRQMPGRICVVSDAMRLSGMPDGQGMLGVNLVTVKDGRATLEDGTIAGSVTNLHDELKNLVSWGIPLEDRRACDDADPGQGDRHGRGDRQHCRRQAGRPGRARRESRNCRRVPLIGE